MSNPFEPGAAGMPAGAMMMPPDLAKKAGNIQLMGILSIVLGICCCPPAGLVLGIIVMVQAPGVQSMLQQVGGPPDLLGKVNTGKICGIIGLVFSILAMLGGVAANVAGLLNR
jgi:hypothetical protein